MKSAKNLKKAGSPNMDLKNMGVGSGKTASRKMTVDKQQTFLLKGIKQRPATAKPKKAEHLETNQL